MRTYMRGIAVALLGVAVFGFGVGVARAESSALTVPVNRSELLMLSDTADEVVVANPAIADVYVHGAKRISVIGRSIGTTNLRIFDPNGKVIKDMVVSVIYDLPAIRKALNGFFPGEELKVEMVNDNVALTGEVSDASVAQKAVQIVSQFVNGASASGSGTTAAAGTGVDAAIASTGSESTSSGIQILNLTKIRSGQQVMLRVRVGEIQRTTLKELGFNLDAARTAGGFGLLLGSGLAGSATTTPFSTLGAALDRGSFSLDATLDALEQDGLFKVLAEPNLVAMSGEKAEFLAGGEFPVPVAQQGDTVTIEFRQFGVSVQFTPFVLTANRIRLVVQPEVSELTDTGSIIVDGLQIPALSSRKVNTTVELAPGESFMIAGLISDTVNTQVNETPGVAEVPVLSSLFRHSSFERKETELVVAVTPYMVDPSTGDQIRLPTDEYKAPSMMESFFYGALGSLSGDATVLSQNPSLEGPVGFMVD
ncbi:MAG: type II and III secretion system protein family protein [Alphaproteobacteria bacterium]|nr:type II and III secretion system protein family protein [Alphaproteobacteria bacterium]